MTQTELYIKSSFDGTMQPSLFFAAKGERRPLLIGLHTWSFDRSNPVKLMLPYAEKYDFNLLCPNFRGANLISNPEHKNACGSMAARLDIKDAIDYVKAEYDVDEDNIFLLGLSGGGHMALMMAGLCPEYFKAIGAVVPISDLVLWHKQSESYRAQIDACCSSSEEIMLERSPISYIDEIAKANLKIFHGKYDKVVPVIQSIRFYGMLTERHPEAKAYLDIFDGGHEIDMESSMHWLLTQYKKGANKTVTG